MTWWLILAGVILGAGFVGIYRALT